LAEEKRRRDEQKTRDVTRLHPEDRELEQLLILYRDEIDRYIFESKQRGIDQLRHEAQRFQQAAWSRHPAQPQNRSQAPYFQADDPEGFTIIIVAGVPLHAEYDRPLLPYGTSTITGVQLVGMSQVINSSGEPVLEQYSFIAREVVPWGADKIAQAVSKGSVPSSLEKPNADPGRFVFRGSHSAPGY